MTQKVEDARVPQTDEDSLELAIQYLEAGNEEQVVPMLRRMADRGTADALELLAQCYASGTGAAWDLREAERLLAKWARQGDGEAKLSLALRYKKGIDVPKSLHYADKWLKRAQRAGAPDALNRLVAEKDIGKINTGLLTRAARTFSRTLAQAKLGDLAAQNRVGILLSSGHGVEQDFILAAAWFRMAAEKGFMDAQFHLGCCYECGRGTNRDAARAMEWYRRAAEQGHAEAMGRLGYCC